MPVFMIEYRAKNHISPEEPYFATFLDLVVFNILAQILVIFYADGKKILEFTNLKERSLFL